jgi:hypothetical protein
VTHLRGWIREPSGPLPPQARHSSRSQLLQCSDSSEQDMDGIQSESVTIRYLDTFEGCRLLGKCMNGDIGELLYSHKTQSSQVG